MPLALDRMTNNLSATVTKIDWASLGGTILEGGYELKDMLDARENAAKLSVRILGSGGKTGTAYFLALEGADADDQLDIWTTLREAPHPNVSRPLTVGRRDIAGVGTVYMVLADPDEKLAAVVPERPLEWEEAAEVLHSCEKGLAHLHAHGFLHGALSPQTVEAVGYTVLLNTEDVHRIGKTPRVVWNKPRYLAPESKSLNLTTASDVWCLGATLFEVLSQERYGTPGIELDKGLPLAAVIQRCLDKNPLTRCTLKEAPSLENAPIPAPAPVETPKPVAEAAPPKPTPKPAPPTPEAKRPAAASPRPQPTTSAKATPPASRIPQPLTPPSAPKPVTKEDMALVPMGKRHRRVHKQPVGARIRTLDGQEDAPAVGESVSTAIGPPVAARVRALGTRPSFARNVLAAVGLAVLFVAAIWFIIIPKLKSSEQPIASNLSGQPVPENVDTAVPNVAPQSAAASEAPLPLPGSKVDGATTASTAADTKDKPAATSDTVTAPPKPARRTAYRVVLGTYPTRNDAAAASNKIAADHPELFLMVDKMRLETNPDLVWVVAVGGKLGLADAEPLRDRLLKKKLNARLEIIGQY